MLLGMQTGYAQESELSMAVSKLSSQENHEVIGALEVMGRICDESCVPWLSDMMRHADSGVIIAACRAAKAMGNPQLAPALLSVIRHHPINEVRLEALQALTRMERFEDYEALLATVDPKHPDEIQRRILRSLPQGMLKTHVEWFASFAQTEAFVTSVAEAYRNAPELLFEAVCDKLMHVSSRESRKQLFRTLAILSKSLPEGFEIDSRFEVLFWDNPEDDLEWLAMIQSELSTQASVHWLLTWALQLSPASLLDVFERIHGEAASQLTDAVILADKHDSSGQVLSWERHIAQQPALARAFLRLLARHPGKHSRALALALRHAKDVEIAISAWQILGYYADDTESQTQLVAQLGHSNRRVAVAVMHIAAEHPVLWQRLAQMILEASDIDIANAVYFARWALVLAATRGDLNLPQAVLDALVDEARQVSAHAVRLHAEPALRFLHAVKRVPALPSQRTFGGMRSDMKRAWLQILSPEMAGASELVIASLQDGDEAVRALAWHVLSYVPAWAKQIETDKLDAWLREAMQSDRVGLCLQASAAAGRLGRTAHIETLQNLLTHLDTRVAYNALWALQKLRALPRKHGLKSLYYRASDGLLRERLGFLTGLDEQRQEFVAMSELNTRKPLKAGQYIQVLMQNQPRASHEMTVIQSDQSLSVARANVFGFIFLPESLGQGAAGF